MTVLDAGNVFLRYRDEYETAHRDFRRPERDASNWALDYFAGMARGDGGIALHAAGGDGSSKKVTSLANFGFIKAALLLLLICCSQLQAQSAEVVRARALRDSGRYRESIELLQNYLQRAPADYNAELVLAEAYYWSGDFGSAARHFRSVLRRDPNNAAAKRQLDEIRATMRPVYELSVNFAHDNQPTNRSFATAGFRYFLTPFVSARLRLTGEHATAGNAALDRIDPEISLTAAIAKGFSINAAFERPRYTATISSLTTPVNATTARLALQLDRKNWLGEAAVQHVGYSDDNTALTAYAWLLAPVLRSDNALLQVGYAFGWNDAAESRFSTTGLYDPYFTPEQETVHSIAASMSTWTKRGVRFQVNGSYGIKADRDAPSIQGRVIRFARQSFQPYQAHAGVTFPLSRRATLTIDAEHTKTAFYNYNRTGVSTSVR